MKVTKEFKLTILSKKRPDFTPNQSYYNTPQKDASMKCLTNLREYSRQKVS